MKKYFPAIAVVMLVVPSVAFASWWNPFTWFAKKTPEPTQQMITVPSVAIPAPVPKIDKPKPAKTPVSPAKNSSVSKPTGNSKATSLDKEPTDVIELRKQVIAAFVEQSQEANKRIKIENVRRVTEQLIITDLKEKISGSEGFIIGNPVVADEINYFIRLYKGQIDFETRRLDALAARITQLEYIKDFSDKQVAAAPAIKSKEELIAALKYLENIKSDYVKMDASSKQWAEASNNLQARVDGIIAGVRSSYSGSENYQTVTPTYPAAYVPTFTPSNRINCTSKVNFIGELETSCY